MWGENGTITVYFKNTIGWSNVYVTFLTSSYWDAENGSGAYGYTSQEMEYDSSLGLYKRDPFGASSAPPAIRKTPPGTGGDKDNPSMEGPLTDGI